MVTEQRGFWERHGNNPQNRVPDPDWLKVSAIEGLPTLDMSYFLTIKEAERKRILGMQMQRAAYWESAIQNNKSLREVLERVCPPDPTKLTRGLWRVLRRSSPQYRFLYWV
ncbi:MAG TPA: hypothetical protein VN711_02525 [Candidatus Saccharimonadales bacterium]|nr:hypothetical protein [Candidatus Saccharimonadales bacterium]